MPVHKDNILAGFGRTRVKIVIIEKERSRSRRKRHDEVRNAAGKVPLFQQKEGAICSSFIKAMPVEVDIPFVTRAFGCKSTQFIDRAFENRGTVGVRAGGSANVSRQDIADTRQRILGIDRVRRKDFRTGQALLVIIGLNTYGDSQLPKIVRASCVIGLGFRSAQSGQQQARQDRNDGNHNEQFDERKGATGGFGHCPGMQS